MRNISQSLYELFFVKVDMFYLMLDYGFWNFKSDFGLGAQKMLKFKNFT
jgi:hypothetical protein